MRVESRELMAGYGQGLGGGSGLGQGGDMMDGQSMAWDATFRDLGQGCG
jgi:hypothetical protein